MSKPMTAKELIDWAERNEMTVAQDEHFGGCYAMLQEIKRNCHLTLVAGASTRKGGAMRDLCRKVHKVRSAL